MKLRTELRPGDIGRIVSLHGTVYAREYGFDQTFEAYVAKPLAEFVLAASPRDRIWLAEERRQLIGCVAIVGEKRLSRGQRDAAQLRWYLVAPGFRGRKLGTRLLAEAIAFCRQCRYPSVFLWTVSALNVAAHAYLAAGFEKTREKPGRRWGVDVVEEKYELLLAPRASSNARSRRLRSTPKLRPSAHLPDRVENS